MGHLRGRKTDLEKHNTVCDFSAANLVQKVNSSIFVGYSKLPFCVIMFLRYQKNIQLCKNETKFLFNKFIFKREKKVFEIILE